MTKNGRHPGRYRALASDGDGTLTRNKRMAQATVAALERLRASGRKVILATGENPEQLTHLPHLDLFDLVVAENGAVLYWPERRAVRPLADPPPAKFIRALEKRGVEPLTVGRVIVCTEKPHDRDVNEVLHELGLDWRVVYNRHEVMAVPAGIDKASGLAAALEELGLSATELAGIGDGENDVPMLSFCGCGAAVASAVPVLTEHADLITAGGTGRGAVELIRRLIAGELPPASRKKRTPPPTGEIASPSRRGKGSRLHR